MIQHKIQINLHSMNEDGSCYADITITATGESVGFIRVVPKTRYWCEVLLPEGMDSWNIDSASWEEVQKTVGSVYSKVYAKAYAKEKKQKTETPSRKASVEFCDLRDDFSCTASVLLPECGITLAGFHVMPSKEMTGVQVYMPRNLGTTWPYESIVSWHTVRSMITKEYKEKIWHDERPESAETPAEACRMEVRFVSHDDHYDYAELVIPDAGLVIEGFRAMIMKTGGIQVYLPVPMGTRWPYAAIVSWKDVRTFIKDKYREYLDEKKEEIQEQEAVSVQFKKTSAGYFFVSVTGISSGVTVEEIRLYPATEETPLQIQIPASMPVWECRELSWQYVYAQILQEYTAKEEELSALSAGIIVSETGKTAKKGYDSRRNAGMSPFRFVPHTVLQIVPETKKPNMNADMLNLVYELAKGYESTFRKYHIQVLQTIAKFRYVSISMLLNIAHSAYLSLPEEMISDADKIRKIIDTLKRFSLIAESRYAVAADDGSITYPKTPLIYTISSAGVRLLNEVYDENLTYNAFDTFRDGNSVKSYLTASQWLVFWLSAYSEQIGNNFQTEHKISYKSQEFTAARIYASVTVNEQPLICEPVRRCEEFERNDQIEEITDKFSRYMALFSHEDDLYWKFTPFIWPERPILIYVCEDDEHIEEISSLLSHQMKANPLQEVWFTCDLRTFNYEYRNKRFFACKDGELKLVNLQETLNLPEEPEDLHPPQENESQ